MFDDSSSNCILNNCGWSLTQEITVANKIQFQQYLVHDEVILKRERNLRAFCHGLNSLGVYDLVKDNPDTMRSLFVYKPKQITAELFRSFISSVKPFDKDEARAFQFFQDFIGSMLIIFIYYLINNIDFFMAGNKSSPNLPDLLHFITGCSVVPPLGLQSPIDIQYQPDSPNAKFPKSQACFSIVMLPVVHDSQECFFWCFLKALELCNDYGNI